MHEPCKIIEIYTFHRNGRASRRPAHPEDRTGAGAQGPVADGQQVTAEERRRRPSLQAEPIRPGRPRVSSPLLSGWLTASPYWVGATPEFCLNLFTFAVTWNAHGVSSDMWICLHALWVWSHCERILEYHTPHSTASTNAPNCVHGSI